VVKHNFTNKKVGILGFGEEGFFTALFLVKHKAKITILDEKTPDNSKNEALKRLKNKSVNFVFHKNAFRNLTDFDLIIRSPIISALRPELVNIKKLGIPVLSQTQIFISECPGTVIGVTGTKGKGTVSTLIYQFLKKSIPRKENSNKFFLKKSSNIYLTGNIGGKNAPLAILPRLKKEDIVVFEMSSFQLEDLTISPKIAVMLQIFPDHLDRHASMKEYVSAKNNITKFQTKDDLLLINIDSPETLTISKKSQANKIIISKDKSLSHLLVEGGKLFFSPDKQGKIELLDLNNSNLLGQHNIFNIGISAITSYLIGAKTVNFNSVLKNFKGLPHRLQLVSTAQGIKFYDDSIATIPDASEAAINSFQSPIILVLGGLVKNISFKNLAKVIKKNPYVKSIIIFGSGQDLIYQELVNTGLKTKLFKVGKSMAKIFDKIKIVAAPGDSILFSPGAASFDMYQNYKKRGEDFTSYAKAYNK